MFYRCFDKISFGANTSGGAIKSEIIPNQQLAEELHKSIIEKFEKRKVSSSFKGNIWSDDLKDMQLICVIDVYSKCAWVATLKNKKDITITNAFQKTLDESSHKPNKILVDKGKNFYNRSMKSWLHDNDAEINSAHNEGKSVAAKRFIKTLKNKINKYITSILQIRY